MTRAQRHRLRWLDDQLAHFVPSCPTNHPNPPECPLYRLRKEKSQTIAQWLAGLTVEDKEYLVLYHQCCLTTKLKDRNVAATFLGSGI